MNKKVDKISLGFENVEAIEIPRKYIYDLRINGVHTNANYDINYRNTFERHSLIADFAELTVDYTKLNQTAETNYGFPAGKRLMAYHDVVDISLHYEDTPDDQWKIINMPWSSLANGIDTDNLWQANRLYLKKSIFKRRPELLKSWTKAEIERQKKYEAESPFTNERMLTLFFSKYNPITGNLLPDDTIDPKKISHVRIGEKDDFTCFYDVLKYQRDDMLPETKEFWITQ